MLSICIVSWNTRDLLRKCLRAIQAYPPTGEYEVIVVDNASPDGSAQMVSEEFPAVRLIANSDNCLYAAGTNQALDVARGDVLLLNPDTQVGEDCVQRLVEFLQATPEAGAVAPQLRWPTGQIQSSCRAFPTPGVLLPDMVGLARFIPSWGRYRMAGFDHTTLCEVDQPMASALLIRREAMKHIGKIDEGFPMFFNDVDLCLRLKMAGWRVFFLPDAVAIHHHGASTTQRKRAMIAQSHESLVRFYHKHYWRRTGAVGYTAVLALAGLAKYARLLRAHRLAKRGS